MNDLSSLLLLLVRKLPLILVLLAGLGFAILRWKRHPRSSLFASIGISLYLVEIFVMPAVYLLLPGQLFRSGISSNSYVFPAIQLFEEFVFSGVLILLVAAAFSERNQTPRAPH